MLTASQREACRLHLDDDLSYAEMAQNFGVSRSAAHDLVRRGIAQLEEMESALGYSDELQQRDITEAELRARIVELEQRTTTASHV